MKILQIFPGKVWGGAEQYILDLGKALTQKGHDVCYIAKDTPAIIQRLNGTITFEIIPANDIFSIKTFLALKAILASHTPDIIHIHDTSFVAPTIMAVKSTGLSAKTILTRHIARHSRTNPLFRPLYRKLHSIVFVSNLAKTYWKEVNPWMPENRCIVIHNSIPDTAIATADSLRGIYSIPQNVPLLIFAGRVRKSKGCETIVRALARLKEKDFAMIFIGRCKPADYSGKIMRIASQGGIADRVFIHGFTTTPRSLMAQADIGLCPSIVREACPLSPMEFMQSGIPVISTTNGGQTEYLHNGTNALLIAPDNDAQLSEAVAQLLDDAPLRKKIGNNAQESFRKHLAYDKFISNMEMAYFNSPDINQ